MNKTTLKDVRVIDLTTDKGLLCGKIFADLGADVIKIEKPGGDKARSIGPFLDNDPHPEKSLFWLSFNAGKRSITLDIERQDGREIFFRLLKKKCCIVIESFEPGYMRSLGLNHESLAMKDRGLIYISISGFGQEGPYSTYQAPDIVIMAMGGEMNLIGSPKQAPLRIGIPQSYLHASVEGALGGIIAFWHREQKGTGQHVDVSAQECIVWEGFQNHMNWDLNKINLSRSGSWRPFGSVKCRFLYPCRDGYVNVFMLGGSMGSKFQKALVKRMDEEGFADEYLKAFDWDSFIPGNIKMEDVERLEKYYRDYFATKTKKELLLLNVQKACLLSPVNTVKDVCENEQLVERNFWIEIKDDARKRTIIYPGAPYQSLGSPYTVDKRAPMIGEHNEEIYINELGLNKMQLSILKEACVI